MTSSAPTSPVTSVSDVIFLDGTFPGSRDVLGGKAYSVNKMQTMGLPVPPAFALPTHVCAIYHDNGRALPESIWQDVLEQLCRLEADTGRTFGAGPSPLLVSVRSGAAQSMPGMMDTVLNLGLTPELCRVLADETGDQQWADDTWQRFRHSYASIVAGDPTAEPPADPFEQLRAAIGAVFDSWTNDRVKAYRARHNLGSGAGTAVTVQAMVFGNRDEHSGTGVMFSRDPATGENTLYGEWLSRAQGEDVVSGEKTPSPLPTVSEILPEIYPQLEQVATILEQEHRDLVDIEFTVESGRLYVLQCRAGKRSPRAAVRIAVDLVREGIIEPSEALARISPEQAAALADSHGVHDHHPVLATGIGAGPGAAVGQAVTDVDEARALAEAGTPVVLVRPSTAPDDVPAMFESVAVVTELGGSTSHAALVCREIGLPCVVGAGAGTMTALAGRVVTVDGTAGTVYDGDALNTDHSGARDEHLDELLSYLPTPVPAEHPLAPLTNAHQERA
ncbi:pyruvate, phosphate dikinase [Gordonia paraffinivorans]|uniref:pyruvate, phosphate dikinase n=1 Tax=Gordonia paraffinivorans TaxID=175628 RepID=UPI000D618AD2|nr:pyruvate, phosphate dikinase [Gordonia paraffinivorans]MBY4572718.1 pyruvate, phosphate dikinase [Gordonia paraffinivorans]PWD43746.1 pyruvate, phosphate dikinase [Gordonia paraffinivorans]